MKIMSFFRLALFVIIPILVSACSKVNSSCLASSKDNSHMVYITNIGWHTGILFPPDSPELKSLPLTVPYPEDHYLEFGWGDRRYYMSPAPGLLDLLRAGLLPTKSVIHIAAFPHHPEKAYSDIQVIPLNMHATAYKKLVSFISESISTDSHSKAESIGHGHYPFSNFFKARGTFWFLDTCNTWVSKALKEAGCKSGWMHPVTTGGLMRRVKKISESSR